jgi:hypothetical protein
VKTNPGKWEWGVVMLVLNPRGKYKKLEVFFLRCNLTY